MKIKIDMEHLPRTQFQRLKKKREMAGEKEEMSI